MKNKSVVFLCALSIAVFFSCVSSEAAVDNQLPDKNSQYASFTTKDSTIFRITQDNLWDVDKKGNHRAVVDIKNIDGDAVLARINWRRPDLRTSQKKIVVYDAKTNQEIQNVLVHKINPEFGEIVFEPTSGTGRYYIYYLPYNFLPKWADLRYDPTWSPYLTAEYEADPDWLISTRKRLTILPSTTAKLIESRLRHDFWTPMGVIATTEETDQLAAQSNKNFLVFPEDRAFPIRLPRALPYRWIEKGPSEEFKGTAQQNEYYTWQLGIWAVHEDVKNIRVNFSDFVNGSEIIPKSALTCFNTEGIGWDGKALYLILDVPKGNIQALWCGMDIPSEAKAGVYSGKVFITTSSGAKRTIHADITVNDELLADRGDGEPWRHSRLRWLNSQIGRDYNAVAPYAPMSFRENKIAATGKNISLSGCGLPDNLQINGINIFKRPVQFIVETNNDEVIFNAKNLKIEQLGDGRIEWTASSQQDGLKFSVKGFMEFDGYARYTVTLSSEEGEIPVKNVKLVLNYNEYSSQYFMGAGLGTYGGHTPEELRWDWSGPCDSYYMGGVNAGTHVELRGASYHGPLQKDYKVDTPMSWSNSGAGSVVVAKNSHAIVTVQSGPRTITSEELDYEFSILITPVKELDTKHQFSQRYFHSDPANIEDAPDANIVNIHHARDLNPIINYPWRVQQPLIDYIDDQHSKGRRVKLYYTIRELTTQATEVYAFMSLNGEIFRKGPGFGYTWPQEHLIDGYACAWYTALENQDADASIINTAFSRYINYYLEGLKWMLVNYKIDGLYMDDVSFDRTVMQRMRKIMEKYRPGSLIDLHSNTSYSVGAANQYADFMPYIDRCWFGEHFNYTKMQPDEWLVTFSGIPFGVMSEMLQGGGNLYRGMVYGAANRYYDANSHLPPLPIWKVWKDFGISNAKMTGYWDENPVVSTSHKDVLATAYLKEGKMLISIASWADKNVKVRLNIDWKKAGLNPDNVSIKAPAIDKFQPQNEFGVNEFISVEPLRGWLLIVE